MVVASAFSLISTPTRFRLLHPAASPPGGPSCSRRVEACWRGNGDALRSGGSSSNHSLPCITSCVARTRRWYAGRSSSITGRASAAAAAVASLVRRKANKREVVVPDPDYRIPIILLGFAGWLVYQHNLLAAAPVGLLGLLLLFQTTRVRFVFDEEALEVKIGDQLQESGENVFVGGKNRWKYSTFVNWELWWPNFPILVYFRETQTKPEGQVHFFPVIFNGKQLYDVMVERAGPSMTSGPKQT